MKLMLGDTLLEQICLQVHINQENIMYIFVKSVL